MVAPPKVMHQWDKATKRLTVTVVFPDGSEPQENALWWSVNRHPDYSIAMEFDAWASAPLKKNSVATYSGEVTIEREVKTLDFITVHAHQENGSTLTMSSPEIRIE